MMLDETTVFTVNETGERTVVAFRDWRSCVDSFRLSGADAFAHEVQSELETLIDQHQCKTLAIDLATVKFLPSLFLAMLTSLSKGKVRIELLQPDAVVLATLKTTQLDRFFVVRS